MYSKESAFKWFLGICGTVAIAGVAAAGLITAAHAENGVTNQEILLGQTTALSGPLAELGSDMSLAAKAYFDYVNQQGGVNGRKIRLITLDDGYDMDKGVANAKSLIENEKVFALFNIMGTGANIALLPTITQARIPHIAPFTGSQASRVPLNPYIFNIRASYADEAEKIVAHLAAHGVTKIAVVHQNNAFGKDGLVGVESALSKHKLKLHASVSIENDASNAAAAAKAIADSKPQAVVMVTAGKPSVEFIKSYDKIATGGQFFTLSVMGTQTAVKALGKQGVGIVVSQVVPFPFLASSGIVREYQQVMTKMGIKNWSFISMEGFLNAKVAVEGLKRAGKDLSRERFLAAMESMSKVDLDGYLVSFSKSDHLGSQYVDLTIIAKDEKFLH